MKAFLRGMAWAAFLGAVSAGCGGGSDGGQTEPPAPTADIFTWTLTFFDAEILGDAAAKTKLSTMAAVAGGGKDNVVIRYNGLP